MERKPFNYEQAIKISSDFQHLVNTPISKENIAHTIHQVTISPFDDENVKIFLKNLSIMDSVEDALENYPKLFFDVIAIYNHGDGNVYRTIRDYAKDFELDYAFPTEFH